MPGKKQRNKKHATKTILKKGGKRFENCKQKQV